ncbi:MAG: CocE/NonD family hydrolase [Acidimicrobiia bacterium]|nr:CocE/NonD family hydrolase [Acidimicrobiia bacterium]
MHRRLRWAVLAVLVLGAAVTPVVAHAAAGPTCSEVSVRMPDGVRLDGWVRKVDGGQHSVLWTMTPYTNNACPTTVAGIDDALAAKFNVVRLSYRGTGASEGVSDQWGPQTRADVLHVGDWIAAQPWAGGLIPTGASAEGAWITYALQHPAVVASLWEMSCADALRGCIRTGGELAGGAFALTAGIVEGYAQGVPQRVQNGHATNPDPASQWAGQADVAQHAYTDDTYTDFWRQRLGLQYLNGIHAPVMYTTDLYDFVPEGMYVAYENTSSQYRWLNLGLGHASSQAERSEGTQLHALIERPITRFLEHFALGVNNGFEHDQRVTLVTNLGTPSGYEQGKVLVRPEADWPLPETTWTRLHLGSGGALSTVPAATSTDVSPLATVTGPRGELRTAMVAASAAPEPFGTPARQLYFDDLRPDEAIGLTYTTRALTAPVELSGPVVLRIAAASTASDFDWQVRLTDVHPDGSSSWITDGQLRASLRAIDPQRSERNAAGDIIRPFYLFKNHEAVPLGKDVQYLIELGPTSNIFAAGDRIRVDVQPVAEGYVDSARTAGVGLLQVRLGSAADSSILLPVVAHRCNLGAPGQPGVVVPPDCAGAIG